MQDGRDTVRAQPDLYALLLVGRAILADLTGISKGAFYQTMI